MVGSLGEQDAGGPWAAAHRHAEELWLALGRRAWRSIVLVPADRDGSSASLATSLVEVGKRLSEEPVAAVVLSTLDFEAVRAMSELMKQQLDLHLRARDPARVVEVGAARVAAVGDALRQPGGGVPLAAAHGRVVISIPPIVRAPLGAAVAQAADAVALAIELGRTRLADARRTVELVGRDRVVGCFLLG